MIEELRKDTIAAFLLKSSNLTEVQLDTLLASNNEGTLDFKASLREKRRVSKGSFARTLNQGYANIESSLFTLFLLAYLDLLPPEKIAQLSRTTRMLTQLKSANPTKDDTLRVIEAMEEFAQGFGRKRKVIL